MKQPPPRARVPSLWRPVDDPSPPAPDKLQEVRDLARRYAAHLREFPELEPDRHTYDCLLSWADAIAHDVPHAIRFWQERTPLLNRSIVRGMRTIARRLYRHAHRGLQDATARAPGRVPGSEQPLELWHVLWGHSYELLLALHEAHYGFNSPYNVGEPSYV